MKISEIIIEAARLHKDHQAAIPNGEQYPSLYNNPYEQYRFGIALAGAPRPDFSMEKDGPGKDFMSVAYSKADEEIIKSAKKTMGQKGMKAARGGSNEAPEVHVRSPINPQPPVKRKSK